jgi:phosphonopyruvate decarboxylase
MDAEVFLQALDADFFCGVPDSLLRPFCDALLEAYGDDTAHHVIAANEGNACAIAAGHYLATGRVPVVYLQNSGLGNTVNPLLSLLHPEVYAIPVLFVIGWRGAPGVHDEPQHRVQGALTGRLLTDCGLAYEVVTDQTNAEDLSAMLGRLRPHLAQGESAALIIRPGALTGTKTAHHNDRRLLREEAVGRIAAAAGDDPIVATTGKASRELYEWREAQGQDHSRDFLTVGSMGHASSIALGLALARPDRRIWCIDGDGAALMHLGAMAVIGKCAPANLVQVVIDNAAHESVGGAPTAASSCDLASVARACGFRFVAEADDGPSLAAALARAKAQPGPACIRVACAIGARSDLGRPQTTPGQNKEAFMKRLQE